jgi:queuine tRNA-ribosyltransferase
MLLTQVNLAYYQTLMRGAREAIAAGTFLAYRDAKKQGWAAGDIPPR